MPAQEPNPIESFIAHCEKLTGQAMGQADRDFTARRFHAIRLKKSEFFIKAGDIPQHLAFTANGLLRCYQVDHNGREITKLFCAEGSFCSAYGALINQRESSLYIQALEDCVILRADYGAIAPAIDQSPFFLLLMKKCLEQIVLSKEEREEDLLRLGAREYYQRFLRRNAGIVARVKDEHIASYLGITPQSLSRIRKNLTKLPNGK